MSVPTMAHSHTAIGVWSFASDQLVQELSFLYYKVKKAEAQEESFTSWSVVVMGFLLCCCYYYMPGTVPYIGDAAVRCTTSVLLWSLLSEVRKPFFKQKSQSWTSNVVTISSYDVIKIASLGVWAPRFMPCTSHLKFHELDYNGGHHNYLRSSWVVQVGTHSTTNWKLGSSSPPSCSSEDRPGYVLTKCHSLENSMEHFSSIHGITLN